jgi:MFS family permease
VGGAAAVVAAVFAGVVVDRVDRRRLLIGCDLVRLVLYGVIPVVWLFGPQVWLLYAVLPLCEAVGTLFAVGYVTVVRSLVGTAQLTEANGRLDATAAPRALFLVDALPTRGPGKLDRAGLRARFTA